MVVAEVVVNEVVVKSSYEEFAIRFHTTGSESEVAVSDEL